MQKESIPVQVQPLLTIPTVAKVLGVSRPTVYGFINNDGLPVIKLGKTIRVSPLSLQNWLAERERVR